MINQDSGGGEDESSTEREGDDSHLHDDQKAPRGPSVDDEAADTKTQDLVKAGRDGFDPNAGTE